MSSNNVVWVMLYRGNFHVFYSGCFDDDPIEPDFKNEWYGRFPNREDALVYAHDVVNKINEECLEEGYAGVEYGVCEVPCNYADNTLKEKIFHMDIIIEEWEQKIKDLRFRIEQFEDWKKEFTKRR